MRKPATLVLVLAPVLTLGCENTLLDRSLLFSTHTTMGLEVAVNPSDVAAPGKLIIGYRRYEGVVNPVYFNHHAATKGGKRVAAGGKHLAEAGDRLTEAAEHIGGSAEVPTRHAGDPLSQAGDSIAAAGRAMSAAGVSTEAATDDDVDRFYRAEAYSVLAKFRGDAEASISKEATGKLAIGQWFATGEAAKLLAQQPGIAGAISGSSEVGEAAADEAAVRRGFAPGSSAVDSINAVAAVDAIQRYVDGLAKQGDEAAAKISRSINTDISSLLPEISYVKYQVDPLSDEVVGDAVVLDPGDDATSRLRQYNRELLRTIDTLSEAVNGTPFDFKAYGDTSARSVTAGSTDLAEVRSILERKEAELTRLREGLSGSKSVREAVAYFQETALGDG